MAETENVMELEDVMWAIRMEREYQRHRFGTDTHDRGVWMAILLDRLHKAAASSIEGDADQCMQEILTVAAVAVAAMEGHGTGKPRENGEAE